MGKKWYSFHKHLDGLSVPGNGQNRVQRYGFVILLVTVFFFIKATLFTVLGKDIPFLFSLLIVILSAWFGGLRPGLFATVLTGLTTYLFFLESKQTVYLIGDASNMVILTIFLLEGIFISLISESHRRSDTQKSEFIGVISHELKNPLTSIKGYSELIQRKASKKGEAKISEYASRIDKQVNHVLNMINDMLDISKIETGRLTYVDETFNIYDLIQEIVNDQQVTTDTHKINFSSEGNKFIVGDRYRIGQVVTNLISNAIKYSPEQNRVILSIEEKKNGTLISVQDFGAGISKEDQDRLFEAFYRGKNTQRAKGTGIGLFISAQIVERHKGKLWVKSRKGKGSIFYLQLK